MPQAEHSNSTSDDAELIAVCERLVAREAEGEAQAHADPHAPDAGPNHTRYLELMQQSRADCYRLFELPGPTTPEGARAVARAALAIVPRTTGGEIMLYDRDPARLAFGCAEFLVGRAPGDDAELIRQCEEFHRINAEADAHPAGDEDGLNAILDRREMRVARLVALPARTDAGRRAKCSVALVLFDQSFDGEEGATEEGWTMGVVFKVLRDVAGRAAA
jgi:hypothetical protein